MTLRDDMDRAHAAWVELGHALAEALRLDEITRWLNRKLGGR